MAKHRKLNTIKRRLSSFDNITAMQRCQLCKRPTVNSTGRCAKCRKEIGLVTAKMTAQAQAVESLKPLSETVTVDASA